MSTTSIARSIRTKKLGLLLYDARLAARRSVEECATAIGTTPEAIKDFEAGKKAASLPEIELLADFLEVPVDHFWGATSRSLQGPTREPLDWQTILPTRQQTLGSQLRQAVEHAGMDPAILAEKTGIAPDQLNRYLAGDEPVSLPNLEAIAALLDRDVSEWMDYDGPVGMRRRQLKSMDGFIHLPAEQQAFILQPSNQPYIQIAMHLSQLPAEKLRAIAEGLLEITL